MKAVSFFSCGLCCFAVQPVRRQVFLGEYPGLCGRSMHAVQQFGHGTTHAHLVLMLATVVGPSPNWPQFCHSPYMRPGGVTEVDHENAQLSRLLIISPPPPPPETSTWQPSHPPQGTLSRYRGLIPKRVIHQHRAHYWSAHGNRGESRKPITMEVNTGQTSFALVSKAQCRSAQVSKAQTQGNTDQPRATRVNTGQGRSTYCSTGQHSSSQLVSSVNTGQQIATRCSTGQRR